MALRALPDRRFHDDTLVELPYRLPAKVSNRIVNEVRGINQVVYDISGKPPATIEWE
jgi:GMP synthase (glutamine-hydrolysing)